MSAPLKSVGETLTWRAGAGAHQLSRRGKVIAILPAGESLKAAIAATGRLVQRVEVDDFVQSARYVVEVSTPHGPAYYAPVIATSDKAELKAQAIRAKLARVAAR